MEEYSFETVEKIIKYVMPRVDNYRKFPSYKKEMVRELDVIFNVNSKFLFTVVKDNEFAATFTQRMGIGRMQALKKLLYAIDYEYYRHVNFGKTKKKRTLRKAQEKQ